MQDLMSSATQSEAKMESVACSIGAGYSAVAGLPLATDVPLPKIRKAVSSQGLLVFRVILCPLKTNKHSLFFVLASCTM